LPRALLAPLVADLDALHGRILQRSTALNAMLARHLGALYDEAPGLAAKDAGAAAHGTAALVAAFAGASAQGRGMIGQASAGTSLQAARRLIEANVPEPDLGPDFLCQRLGMSRAKLYRLFEPIGGVGAYIQQRRLTRAYHALTDPAQAHLYVGIIATRLRQRLGLQPRLPPGLRPVPDRPARHPSPPRRRQCQPRRRQRVYEHAAAVARDGSGAGVGGVDGVLGQVSQGIKDWSGAVCGRSGFG
jgi:AraC-like DNA-binding protein